MDAKTSRYHEIYARWQRDPPGILGRGRGRDRLDREAEDRVRSERRRLWPLVYRRRLQHLLQRGRPPRRGRPRRAGRDHLRLAGHRTRSRPSPTRRCRPRPRSSPASSSTTSASRRATASSSTCRWCRRRWSACWPARGSARSIRWCSAASRRRSSPPGSTTAKPKVILSASCGIEAARVIRLQAAARRGDRAGEAQARRLPDPATAAGRRPS